MTPTGLALLLSTGAGLSTAIGAVIPFCITIKNNKVLGIALAFSGGVMVFISFDELLPSARQAMLDSGYEWAHNYAYAFASLCFFLGAGFAAVLGWVVHKMDPDHSHDLPNLNPNAVESDEYDTELQDLETPSNDFSSEVFPTRVQFRTSPMLWIKQDWAGANRAQRHSDASRLKKTGLLAALAIMIHNFPEGISTYVGTMADPSVGIALAIAITIHNIPEGICVALPIYFATGSKLKGFLWAFLSGIAEPIGALIGYGIYAVAQNSLTMGILFGLVSGMMTYISFRELIPTAFRYDSEDKYTTFSLIVGMMVMCGSLILFLY